MFSQPVCLLQKSFQKHCNSEYDMLLEEADIDSIIKGKTQYYEEAVVQAVETMVQNFVTDLLNSIRERGIDTKSTYTVFLVIMAA